MADESNQGYYLYWVANCALAQVVSPEGGPLNTHVQATSSQANTATLALNQISGLRNRPVIKYLTTREVVLHDVISMLRAHEAETSTFGTETLEMLLSRLARPDHNQLAYGALLQRTREPGDVRRALLDAERLVKDAKATKWRFDPQTHTVTFAVDVIADMTAQMQDAGGDATRLSEFVVSRALSRARIDCNADGEVSSSFRSAVADVFAERIVRSHGRPLSDVLDPKRGWLRGMVRAALDEPTIGRAGVCQALTNPKEAHQAGHAYEQLLARFPGGQPRVS